MTTPTPQPPPSGEPGKDIDDQVDPTIAGTEAEQSGTDQDAGQDEPDAAEATRAERRDARVRQERDALRSEVNGLRAQVAASRWREVDAAAGQRVADVGDLRLVLDDAALAGLYDQDGGLDVEALEAVLDGVLAEHPAWAARGPAHHGDLGAKRPVRQRRTTWAGVLRS